VVPLQAIDGAWGERRYSSYSFLTYPLDEGERSAWRPGRALPPGKEPPGTHCTGGWVGHRAGLDAEAKGRILCPCRGSNPGRLTYSQTLYCLCYPGHVSWRIISQWVAGQQGVKVWTGYKTLSERCNTDHGNKPLCSRKTRNSLTNWVTHQLSRHPVPFIGQLSHFHTAASLELISILFSISNVTVEVSQVARSVLCLTTDWMTGVRSPTEAADSSPGLCVQTGSVTHPASCTVGTGGSFPGGKARPVRDADHSPPSNGEVKKE
jgi:hypothetical protein